MDKIKNYLTKCSKGDWFILYQLSKNLNRVFFMDFLTTLARTVDPESPARDNEGDEGTRNLTILYIPRRVEKFCTGTVWGNFSGGIGGDC